MEGKEIVLLELTDTDPKYGVLKQFFLVDPDMDKLKELQFKMNCRVDGKNEFTDQGWEVIEEFINKNFKTLPVKHERLWW